jgi:hypothetical protein
MYRLGGCDGNIERRGRKEEEKRKRSVTEKDTREMWRGKVWIYMEEINVYPVWIQFCIWI